MMTGTVSAGRGVSVGSGSENHHTSGDCKRNRIHSALVGAILYGVLFILIPPKEKRVHGDEKREMSERNKKQNNKTTLAVGVAMTMLQ
jgi:hypothetical protein